ncbi:hypothetical protein Tco_0198725, partial [Tanacetum coccineum]
MINSLKIPPVLGKQTADNTNVSIPSVERPWLSEAEALKFPNHDTCIILPPESLLKVTDSLVIVTDYDSADESLVCSTPLLPLKKLAGAEPVYGPGTDNQEKDEKQSQNDKTGL